MAVLICGSLAYDCLMTFEGRFAEQLLPEQLHKISVSFVVPTLRREWGGCAGNIAYALQLLGGAPLPMGAVGRDGGEYIQRLRALGIDTAHVRQFDDTHTAQCMIVTDRDNNQIAAFHPGAMLRAHENRITAEFKNRVRLGIVAPDGQQAMHEHAAQLHAAGIPFVFDPGQNLGLFDQSALRGFIARADWICVNEYEAELLVQRTQWDLAHIAAQVQALVVTLGAQGCTVWQQGEQHHVPPVPAAAVLDPTGCGDAWRGALLFGLARGWSVLRCAALGNRLGALKIASPGPQNWQLDFDPRSLEDASV